jgi:hypothetical protein
MYMSPYSRGSNRLGRELFDDELTVRLFVEILDVSDDLVFLLLYGVYLDTRDESCHPRSYDFLRQLHGVIHDDFALHQRTSSDVYQELRLPTPSRGHDHSELTPSDAAVESLVKQLVPRRYRSPVLVQHHETEVVAHV